MRGGAFIDPVGDLPTSQTSYICGSSKITEGELKTYEKYIPPVGAAGAPANPTTYQVPGGEEISGFYKMNIGEPANPTYFKIHKTKTPTGTGIFGYLPQQAPGGAASGAAASGAASRTNSGSAANPPGGAAPEAKQGLFGGRRKIVAKKS